MRVFEALKPQICPWCLKRFETTQGVETHMIDKHRRNLPLTADAKMQVLHAERLKEAVAVLMTVSPEVRTAIVKTILPPTHKLVTRREMPPTVAMPHMNCTTMPFHLPDEK